ncbi:putative hydrolase of the HAD superfamily [Peribacillus deserti]|uniref:Hydrolase of the HAD superfamily n=1 Tax=Peribacillus deserti TaxID=673318 RepID=A0ABS2QK50_9BACI|nr:putative hydrolase of the HAD superfamily [Peribacillus deserti]
MPETKALLFDLDGTLLERDRSVRLFVKQQYQKYSHHFKDISENHYLHTFISLDQRGYVWKDKVYQTMLENYGITDISWEALLDDYIHNFHTNCLPSNNLDAVFNILKEMGFALGIITNGFTEFQLKNIKALGIERYMDVILISEKEGLKKPNTALFQRTLKVLDTAPDQSIYVGDTFIEPSLQV